MEQIIDKIWGYEKIIENNEKYCLKFLIFNHRWMNSWHMHFNKDETFYVTKGLFYLATYCNGETKDGLLYPGDSIRIKPKTIHRLCGLNFHNEVLEASTYFDDKDVERFKKGREVYGTEECDLHKKERYLK